jgi:hypothetical protein
MIKVVIYDLTHAPFELNDTVPNEVLNLEVRHSRNRVGNKVDFFGGHTLLVDFDHKKVYASKCKHTDRFCRRTGILMALQRKLNCLIIDFSFKKDELQLYIDRESEPVHWFVQKDKNELNNLGAV